jgi:hypothetical protein
VLEICNISQHRMARKETAQVDTSKKMTRRPSTFGTSVDARYGNSFRAKRLQLFLGLADAVIQRKGTCKILDLGGDMGYWQYLKDIWQERQLDITIVNQFTTDEADDYFTFVLGDARDLPQFADNSFDIVHSNSVIEHVGKWSDMVSMAKEVRRLAPTYFIQTPNYWFPMEPHLRVPFIHWLPFPWQRRIVMSRACGYYPRADSVTDAQRFLADAILLDKTAVEALFPDACIVQERFGPLTKSLIAIRQAPSLEDQRAQTTSETQAMREPDNKMS